MTEREWNHCGRKIKYRTENRALNDLNKMRKKGLLIPSNANAYPCKYCGYWHLGHSNRK